MVKSKYISDILLLLIDGFKYEPILKKQIELLNDSEYSYTDAGLIVTFSHDDAINNYKIDFDKILNGVKIASPELELGAQTSLFFDKGLISYLEIFSNSSFYPKNSLQSYRLSQEWLPGGGKVIEYPVHHL